MEFKDCVYCGTQSAMHRFEDETLPVQYKHFMRQVPGLSGWRCRRCSEAHLDSGSAAAFTDAGDRLLEDAQKTIADDMRRIRRKLNLTQRKAVDMLSGGGHNAFSRYERAEVEPPKPLLVLMSLLDRHPALVEEIIAMNGASGLRELASTQTVPTGSVPSVPVTASHV